MLAIMSQNVIRPDEIKTGTLASSESQLPIPRASIDSHHNNTDSKNNSSFGIIAFNPLTSDSTHPTTSPAITMAYPAPNPHKTIPSVIHTTSLDIHNNSSSTAFKSSTSSSTPSSTSSSSESSNNSPLRHIRRWTSGLSSSKKQRQGSPSSSRRPAKGRTIGPIGAPQPLITPAPYACTPLPYFDFPVTPTSSVQSPTKLETSCPDLPAGTQPSASLVLSMPNIITYSTLEKNYRTSWKDRLFYPTGKKQDRRVSTDSNEDDEYDWSSPENDNNSNSTQDSDGTLYKLNQEESGSPYVQLPDPLQRISESSNLRKPQWDAEIVEGSSSEHKGAIDFAASICKGLGSDFVMPPSYFDQHKLGYDADELYPQSEEEDTPKPRSDLRGGFNAQRRASRASSIYSTSSESSTDSTDSDLSDSSDSSQSSPISGASFFSSQSNAASSASKASIPIKSNATKTPSSFAAPLPIGMDRLVSASPPITPPATPPLEDAYGSPKDTNSRRAPAAANTLTDPRALTLKRLAYTHTLKKLREREKRPLRHAVLLHLVIIQLHRGITGKHCDEIGDFYSAMWTTQFPVRWDITNPMSLSQRQQSPPKQNLANQSKIQQQQEQGQESSKSTKAKPKRSLILSLQNRIQSSKSQSNSNEALILNDSNAVTARSTTHSSPQLASLGAAPVQSPAPKARLPVMRMPSYPLISLEKKSAANATNIPAPAPLRRTPGMSFTPIRSSGSNSPDSESEESEDEDSNNDNNMRSLASGVRTQQNELIKQAPTFIIPKQTTGRKGFLYQQQQQLRIQFLQQSATQGEFSTPSFPNAMGQFGNQDLLATEQSQAIMQAQLLGARPQFTASTYTTVLNNQSGLIIKPLVAPSTVEEKTSVNNSWKHQTAMNPAPSQSYGIHSIRMSHYEQSASLTQSEENGSTIPAPAGLPTPPLSPLFRPSLPSPPLGSTQTQISYLPPNFRPQMHSYIPTRVPSPSFSTSIASFSVPVLPFMLSHAQHQHHSLGYAENYGQHAHMASSGSRPTLESPLPQSLQATGIAEKILQGGAVKAQPGLPSPPLSPTLGSETITGVTDMTRSGGTAPKRINSSPPPPRDRQVSEGSIGSVYSESHRCAIQTAQDIRTRINLDDARGVSRKQKPLLKDKGGLTGEEEDVPLALVQRRISTDVLQSTI